MYQSVPEQDEAMRQRIRNILQIVIDDSQYSTGKLFRGGVQVGGSVVNRKAVKANLRRRRKFQLRKDAKDLGVKGFMNMSKKELVSKIASHPMYVGKKGFEIDHGYHPYVQYSKKKPEVGVTELKPYYKALLTKMGKPASGRSGITSFSHLLPLITPSDQKGFTPQQQIEQLIGLQAQEEIEKDMRRQMKDMFQAKVEHGRRMGAVTGMPGIDVAAYGHGLKEMNEMKKGQYYDEGYDRKKRAKNRYTEEMERDQYEVAAGAYGGIGSAGGLFVGGPDRDYTYQDIEDAYNSSQKKKRKEGGVAVGGVVVGGNVKKYLASVDKPNGIKEFAMLAKKVSKDHNMTYRQAQKAISKFYKK